MNVRELALCGLFAAIVAVMSLITIPLPGGVPITLQTFAVPFCGYMLGAKRGLWAMLVYEAIGAVGLPVFSGMRGGIAVLAGPTGGFLVGFFAFVLLCGLRTRHRLTALLLGAAGLLLCHAAGCAWYAVAAGTSLISSFMTASLPFLVKDFLSVTAAWVMADICKKRLPI